MTEAELQTEVLKLGKLYGWLTAHFRPAWTSKGYRTPVQGDGKGFPDLVLVRPPRLIFVELKSMRGSLDKDQRRWYGHFKGCPGAETYLWKPSDLLEIAKILEG